MRRIIEVGAQHVYGLQWFVSYELGKPAPTKQNYVYKLPLNREAASASIKTNHTRKEKRISKEDNGWDMIPINFQFVQIM